MKKQERVSLEFPLKAWRWSRWQRDVWNATRDLDLPSKVFLNAGRGAGKDIVSIRCILRDALKLYSEKKRATMEGGDSRWVGVSMNPVVKIWVVAPGDDNLAQVWDDWRGELRAIAREWGAVAGHDENDHEWFFREIVREGKYVVFGTNEIVIERRLTVTKGALRGAGVDFTHWTEFALQTAPGQLFRAYRQELQGTRVRAGRQGRLYATTTPYEPEGVFHEELVKAIGEDVTEIENAGAMSEDGLTYYHSVDSFANDFLTETQRKEIESERADGWIFERERLARFVIGDKGGEKVFPREWIEGCLHAPAERPTAMREDKEWVLVAGSRTAEREERLRMVPRRIQGGCDIARLGNDATWLLPIDQDTGEILTARVLRKETGPAVISAMEQVSGDFPQTQWHVDDTGHRGYIADFAPKKLKIVAHQFSRAKEKWVNALRILLETGRLRIPDPKRCAWMTPGEKAAMELLIKELLNFVKIVNPKTNAVEYRHPNGMTDDGVDALMLGSMGISEMLPGRKDLKEVKRKVGRIMI